MTFDLQSFDLCIYRVDIGTNGKSLGDIVQGVRFKGLFPGSGLRNELITSLCIGKKFKNESALLSLSLVAMKVVAKLSMEIVPIRMKVGTWYLRTSSSTSESGFSVSWAASGVEEPTI